MLRGAFHTLFPFLSISPSFALCLSVYFLSHSISLLHSIFSPFNIFPVLLCSFLCFLTDPPVAPKAHRQTHEQINNNKPEHWYWSRGSRGVSDGVGVCVG